ncbi:hypothetical protein DDR33_08235 [Pararcticibacter amylolyticus]|uniref:Uncharacterized protein n=2 Tax=Pararcticibacter amylolyticus TaxID=2173175 RepID=A0A2U2PIV8_9SPHI|nr:hypothetical protein DDR33_08235 [Pararcticibacter amylolyticus]
MLNQLFSPAVALGLTSGPTAPEATSFEPVDTTDMVNLLTGDLAYNLPLLEVPGPEGGYPLSLSYHAGIQPNEDASWVGLGWTLNPGAINRAVNGFPDDWYGAQSSRRDYWEGGKKSASRIGFSIPAFGGIGYLGFGLSFSNDTFLGRSFGADINGGIGIPNTPLTIGAGAGANTRGDYSAWAGIGGKWGSFSAQMNVGGGSDGWFVNGGVGIGAEYGPYAMDLGLGASVNREGVAGGFMISQRLGVLGVSMSSDGGSSFSVGGYTASTQNSKAGSISTQTKKTDVNLIFASYSRTKTRYWSNETESSFMYGSLYPGWQYYIDVPDAVAYDAYTLQEEDKNIVDDPEPNKRMGGSFPSYDQYQVTAQGLGGSMRPYRFEGEAIQQNRWEKISDNLIVQTVKYITNSSAVAFPEFRFENDFSNNYLQNYPDFMADLDSRIIAYPPPYYGPLIEDDEWAGGFSGNELAGSKYISYSVTRSDGTVSTYGNNKFITPIVNGLNRKAHTFQSGTATHIAGFAITSESGVTYHYNLPAYSYDEEMYQEFIGSPVLQFNRQTRNEGYAYTWYLTAITGPDYVDRGTVGVIDSQDYGHWISFEYGKWSDKYAWRNPSEGYYRDDDNRFRSVSMGKREVYYLNAIRTRSHTALFEKDVRYDAKGESPEIFNKNWAGSPISSESNYQNEGVFNTNSSQSLRLDKIYLLNNSDASIISPASGGSGSYIPPGRSISCSDCELHANVLDKNDVNAVGRAVLEAKAIRIIDFNYDYSLVRGTVNSYNINSPSTKYGKLTLNSVKFRGVGGADLLPSIDFQYGLDATAIKSSTGTLTSNSFITSSSAFIPGDLLETSGGDYCGVIVSKAQSGNNWVYSLKNGKFSGSGSFEVRTTKNPPYNKDQQDVWGMFKSDYSGTSNENLNRLTNPISNRATDVWSLRTIKTGLGAEISIDYEGDTYGQSILNKNRPLIISDFSSQGGNNFYYYVNTEGQNLNDLFKVGDELDMTLFKEGSGNTFTTISTSSYSIPPRITSISGDYMYIYCPVNLTNDILYGGGSGTIRTGNLKLGGNDIYYGGGIRVKSVTIDNLAGVRSTAQYGYLNRDQMMSSGVTSYEPITQEMDNVASSVTSTNTSVREEAAKVYRRELYKDMSRLLSISREVPGPGVMYEYVTVTKEVYSAMDNQTRQVPGRTVYQFEVFRKNMVGKEDVSPRRSAPKDPGLSSYYTRNLVLKKFVSNIGALKRVTAYDIYGNKLSETINHYLHDGLEGSSYSDFMNMYEQRLVAYKKQGLIKERYSEVKYVWTGSDANWDVMGTMSAREEYPAICTGQTVVDNTTGIQTSSVNQAFDFYSGAVTQKIVTDSYGNKFMQEVIPAYRRYWEMGLKMQSQLNKNMLTQEAATYTYKLDNSNAKLGLVSSAVQLWGVETPVTDGNGINIIQNDAAANGKVWRKTDAYAWIPDGQTADGLTAISNFVDFDWESVSQNAFWKKTGKVSLFDVFSKPLESIDINGIRSSSKMGYNDGRVVVSGSNVAYNEMAFAGFEDGSPVNGKLSTNVNYVSGTIASAASHSGRMSLIVAPNKTGISYILPLSALPSLGKDYVASVWFQTNANNLSAARLYYSVASTTVFATLNLQKQSRGWYLLELKIPGSLLSDPTKVLTVSCANVLGATDIFFDDFRFQPLQAQVNSYVYDALTGELTNILDNNNLFTRFEYDAVGRLTKVYKEVLGKGNMVLVKENLYNYQKKQL